MCFAAQVAVKDIRVAALQERLEKGAQENAREVARLRMLLFELEMSAGLDANDDEQLGGQLRVEAAGDLWWDGRGDSRGGNRDAGEWGHSDAHGQREGVVRAARQERPRCFTAHGPTAPRLRHAHPPRQPRQHRQR